MTPEVIAISHYLNSIPDIRQAYLFGSLAKGAARMESDADIAISTSHPLLPEQRLELIEQLAALSGRAVDLIDLNLAGEPLLGEILNHGIRLKGTDSQHAELIKRHIFDSEDFLPYVRRMLKERRQSWTA